MPNVGFASLQVIPSLRGVQQQLTSGMVGPSAQAGAEAGQQAGGGFLKNLPGGPKLVAALGIGAIGVAAFKAASEVDAAFDKIRVASGATGPQLAGLQDVFKDVVRDIPTDFGKASDAIAQLSQRAGEATQGELKRLAERELELARITGTDLTGNVKASEDAFHSWGIVVGDQPKALDQLFRASQVSGASVGDLSSQLASSGVVLRTVGFDFQHATGLLASLAHAGVDAGDVMPALSRALATAAKEGKPAAEVFRQTLDAIKNAPDEATAAGDALEIFGARAGPKLAALIREGKLGYEEFTAAIVGGKDTIHGAAKDTDDVGESFQRLKNEGKLLLADIGKPIFKGLSDSAADALPVMDKLGGAFEAIQPAIGPAVLGVGAFFAATKVGVPLLTTMAKGLDTVALSAASLNAERSFAGLTAMSDGLGRLSDRLPGIAGAATAAAISFDQIGKSTVGSVAGIGSLVATGAEVGSIFGPWGTAAGAAAGGIAGLTKALFGAGESAEEAHRKVVSLSTTLEGLTNQKAAKSFFDQYAGSLLTARAAVTRLQAEAVPNLNLITDAQEDVGRSTRRLQDRFADLAKTSPAAAQRVLTGFREMRDEAGKPIFSEKEITAFDRALNLGEATLQRYNARKAESQKINDKFAASEDKNAASLDEVSASADKAAQEVKDLQDTILGASNGDLAYQQSLADVQDAQGAVEQAAKDVATAVKEHGASSTEAADAQRGLEKAQRDLTRAQLSAAESADSLDAANSGLINGIRTIPGFYDQQIARLEELKRVHPEAAAGYQLEIDKLVALKKKADELPPMKSIGVTVDASAAFAQLAALGITIGSVTAEQFTAHIGFLGFADGGIVPGPKGAPVLAVVHGGETVIPPDASFDALVQAGAVPSVTLPANGGGNDDHSINVDIGSISTPEPIQTVNLISERLRTEQFFASL